MNDIARYMVNMAAKTYTGIGTLTLNPEGETVVGPLLTPQIHLTHPAQIPVCGTSAENKIAQLDHLLRLVREKRLGWDASRWGKCDPVWFYVIYLEARELVRQCAEMNRSEPTYLRHIDDHWGQFLADKKGNVTGIIDFELQDTSSRRS